jgi:hypothetical protein
LDLVFTNVPVDMAVESAETPLLKLGSVKGSVTRYRMKFMVLTGAAFFRVEGSTNACTYSTRRSEAALKDMCLRDILAVNKNCHV